MLVGCNNNNLNVSNNKNEEISIENEIPYMKTPQGGIDGESIDNSIIDKRYKTVNKDILKYDFKETTEYIFEFDDGFAVNSESQDFKPINDKKYQSILLGYTYSSEVSSTIIPYDEAISMVKKVLPNDIIKEKSKMTKDNSCEYIFFKSNKGNFVVGLHYALDYELNRNNPFLPYNKNIIAGIDYLKQIN